MAEAFPGQPVVIRTFDLGGDKFPAFLHIGREENPFLGWRAIRVCLDEPEIFRTQLRALGRALRHGDIRIMLPLVNAPVWAWMTVSTQSKPTCHSGHVVQTAKT